VLSHFSANVPATGPIIMRFLLYILPWILRPGRRSPRSRKYFQFFSICTLQKRTHYPCTLCICDAHYCILYWYLYIIQYDIIGCSYCFFDNSIQLLTEILRVIISNRRSLHSTYIHYTLYIRACALMKSFKVQILNRNRHLWLGVEPHTKRYASLLFF
jgi:hypothetical protein